MTGLVAATNETVRKRKRSVISSIVEDDLHRALVQWLELQRINGKWWHTPNTSSSIPYAVKLKKLGRKKGVLDLQFLRKPQFNAFIELKRHPQNLSDDQREFCAFLDDVGVPYAVIRTKTPEATISQAQTFLRTHGFIAT